MKGNGRIAVLLLQIVMALSVQIVRRLSFCMAKRMHRRVNSGINIGQYVNASMSMQIEMSDKKCEKCQEALYKESVMHTCGDNTLYRLRRDNVTCKECLKEIILYNHWPISYWRYHEKFCNCEHEVIDE